MKNLLLIAIAILGFSAVSFGQTNVATATATANILSSIAITKTGDMNFGSIASGLVGTVVLTPAGVASSPESLVLTGTPTAAHFLVTGDANRTYAITLPATSTTVTSGANTMLVDTWASTPVTTGTLGVSGQTIDVGATLHVGAGQVAGTYVSGTAFTITVNYN